MESGRDTLRESFVRWFRPHMGYYHGEQKYMFEDHALVGVSAFSKDSKFFAWLYGYSGDSRSVQVADLFDGSIKWRYEAADDDEISCWKSVMEWHPDGKILAVSGDPNGEVHLLDVDGQKLLQKRTLRHAEPNGTMGGPRVIYTKGAGNLKFTHNGNVLITWTLEDSSIEVYHFEKGLKWRFGRGGTEDGPRSHEWRDEKGLITSRGGYGMLFWQGESEEILKLASIDFDAVRIWSIGLSQGRDDEEAAV